MLFSITILIYGCSAEKEEEQRVTTVEVIPVEKKDISQWITLTSQLQPMENIMIFSKTPGLTVTDLKVKLGDRVREGDLLFELDKSLVRQQVEVTRASYEMAKDNYNKQRELLEDQQRALEDIQVVSGNRGLSMFTKNNTDIQANAEVSLVAASSQVEQSKMVYANALKQLNELDYHAPIDGVISQLNINENQIVLNQQPALVITNTKTLKSNVFITEDLLDKISMNQEVLVDINNDLKSGNISLINTVPDVRTNLYQVEILIDNSSDELKVGNFNKIRFEKQKRERVNVVPKDCLIFEGKDTYVFIEEGGRVSKRKVVYGIEQDNYVEIISGVKEGEMVVIRGQQYVKDEMQVKVVRGAVNESI